MNIIAHYYNATIDRLLPHSQPTSDLREHILNFSPSSEIEASDFPQKYLTAVRKLVNISDYMTKRIV